MTQAITNILCVGLGSFAGGIARYLLSKAVQTGTGSAFPWGTLAVNLAGCLLIGFIFGLIDRGMQLSQPMRLLLTTGFCGGFTTFSTFIHENSLLIDGASGVWMVAAYAAVSFAGGMALVYAGMWGARMVI